MKKTFVTLLAGMLVLPIYFQHRDYCVQEDGEYVIKFNVVKETQAYRRAANTAQLQYCKALAKFK